MKCVDNGQEDYNCWLRALEHKDSVYVKDICFYYDNGHGRTKLLKVDVLSVHNCVIFYTYLYRLYVLLIVSGYLLIFVGKEAEFYIQYA